MRFWVIGNGKSLLETPLEKLIGEKCIAMNRIHLLYDKTPWRPTHYLMVDYNTQNPHNYWQDCINAHLDIPKWLWKGYRDGLQEMDPIGEVKNTTWIDRCMAHHYYSGENHMRRAESWHLPEFCTAFSGIGVSMQIAVQLGATEIYLLGCDLYVDDYTENFFVPDYTSDMRDRSRQDNITMTQVHTVANRSSPAKIFNATVGGNLEVYPRVDMLEVLSDE